MIELIFVIVILGIMGAVAFSKLAATRDDAKIAVTCEHIATCITDMGLSYTAKHSATLAESAACSDEDVQPLVSLGSGGATITVSGSPDACQHLRKTFRFGGSNISF